MAPIAVICGLLLIAVGLVGYLPGRASITALIPAFIGGPLVVLGLLAFKDSFRKHAMHLAAVLGLLGFLASVGNLVRIAVMGKSFTDPPAVSSAAMGLTCALFVALCVRSFVQARRARRAAEKAPAA
ncbi:MAG TPA: hypothetical protein VFA26_09280 [Gemmataceae bacterium]|nr:hypothetical protein [Gemmataceae bacterium]